MQMDCKKTAPVGVFDSGVGGLTVAREISRQLPNENIVYFGDTARVPYGSKSQNTIIRFSEQIIRFLKTKQVKAIVIACNTASALAKTFTDTDFNNIMLRMEKFYGITRDKNIKRAIDIVGNNNHYHPIIDKLESLE